MNQEQRNRNGRDWTGILVVLIAVGIVLLLIHLDSKHEFSKRIDIDRKTWKGSGD